LLDACGIPAAILPEIGDTDAEFGSVAPDLLGAAIPIAGIAGDQQAATIGQACFAPGAIKSNYGTGCFRRSASASTARRPTRSKARSSSPVPPCSGFATA
jgi:glycerol kinase